MLIRFSEFNMSWYEKAGGLNFWCFLSEHDLFISEVRFACDFERAASLSRNNHKFDLAQHVFARDLLIKMQIYNGKRCAQFHDSTRKINNELCVYLQHRSIGIDVSPFSLLIDRNCCPRALSSDCNCLVNRHIIVLSLDWPSRLQIVALWTPP
jgi:hypothetical protein